MKTKEQVNYYFGYLSDVFPWMPTGTFLARGKGLKARDTKEANQCRLSVKETGGEVKGYEHFKCYLRSGYQLAGVHLAYGAWGSFPEALTSHF